MNRSQAAELLTKYSIGYTPDWILDMILEAYAKGLAEGKIQGSAAAYERFDRCALDL